MHVPPPPPEIAHIVAAIGAEATLVLLEVYGGTRLYVPATRRGIRTLGKLIGAEPAQQLAALIGNDVIRVPLCKAWRARIYRAQGMTYAAIAKKLGCNDTTVWKYLHGSDQATAQLVLQLG